ncbi:MAG: ABC transporter permease [Paracoccaceae bacterium]|uniref:ABC transporter permease n=1 Tax=Candidatus Salinivivens marinus TaxID=3381703 RepID=UPI000B742479|nr:ABC transporter permease [Marinovum sp.]OUU08821.1 MAG: ABC transporter permease [Rhodobacteraceae bacterium TMED38]PDH61423.1 MAG: ABC transporter permease [Rhodobacteraceae bacterium MED-G08]|tara:strand:- start:3923 stop:4783 length:861 start_codon:yes stop_codon:yes gene_type:complete
MRSLASICVVIGALIFTWYLGAFLLNSTWALDKVKRAGVEISSKELILDTWSQEKPKLPAPHQVGSELWKTTVEKKITSKRSLIFHSWITLSSTLVGFLIGTSLGILLAIGIVHNNAMNMSIMPWAIASQTIPILAIAPMIIVVLNSIGVQGLLPKAIISSYLCFFPVVVGMVKGLRSPDKIDKDLMHTYNATNFQKFWKLRLPTSMPFLFASLKVGISASLVGAIVGELPTGAVRGLGARLLAGSYYGQTIQIWSALIMAAILAAALVGILALLQKFTLNRMGMT